MKQTLLVAFTFLSAFSSADVFWSQPYDGTLTNAVASQEFPDFPTAASYSSDDFVVNDPLWYITKVIMWGMNEGDSSRNLSVKLRIGPTPNFFDSTPFAEGTQQGGDLVFAPNRLLEQGSYWLFAYVVRSFGEGGGQWYWHRTPQITGSEFYFHNPGNYFGFGVDPIPGRVLFDAPSDLTFQIEGELPIPEPATIIVVAAGGLALARRKHQRR